MLCCVEGLIGAGKTTLCAAVRDAGITVLDEPVDVWTSVRDPRTGQDLLAATYEHPKRHAFALQVLCLATIADQIRAVRPSSLVVTERSIHSCHMFSRVGHLDAMQTQIYDILFDGTRRSTPAPKIVVALDTPPDVCLERIRRRARPGEARIDRAYLKQLHRLHEEWYATLNPRTTRLVRLDGQLPVHVLTEQLLMVLAAE